MTWKRHLEQSDECLWKVPRSVDDESASQQLLTLSNFFICEIKRLEHLYLQTTRTQKLVWYFQSRIYYVEIHGKHFHRFTLPVFALREESVLRNVIVISGVEPSSFCVKLRQHSMDIGHWKFVNGVFPNRLLVSLGKTNFGCQLIPTSCFQKFSPGFFVQLVFYLKPLNYHGYQNPASMNTYFSRRKSHGHRKLQSSVVLGVVGVEHHGDVEGAAVGESEEASDRVEVLEVCFWIFYFWLGRVVGRKAKIREDQSPKQRKKKERSLHFLLENVF